ncbi:cupin domain-containing protein [Thiolapillus sp.]
MNKQPKPLPARNVPPPDQKTSYPAPFDRLVAGRCKRKLGDHFGLSNFGINLTSLEPGAISALAHHHSRQDEFVYVLEGAPTLIVCDKEYLLSPGDCCGFAAGKNITAQLVNHSSRTASFLEIGDRSAGDEVVYPHDDLKAVQLANGCWRFTHRNGAPYD